MKLAIGLLLLTAACSQPEPTGTIEITITFPDTLPSPVDTVIYEPGNQ